MSKLFNALQILKSGGIIAHATDTCYGFACDITNSRALARLYKIKKMDPKKPVSILVSGLPMAKQFGYFSRSAKALAKKYWPGPLTIIVCRKKSLPSFLNPGYKTIGFRVPRHRLSLELVRHFGLPLTTTSANISCLASPYSVSAIKKQFRSQKFKPDFYLDSGRLKKNPPSAIIDMSGRKPKIIRQGTLKITEI